MLRHSVITLKNSHSHFYDFDTFGYILLKLARMARKLARIFDTKKTSRSITID